jgi:hypothetical protein
MLKDYFFSLQQPLSLLLHLPSVKKGVFFVSLMPFCIINASICSLSLSSCIVSVLYLSLTLLMTLNLFLERFSVLSWHLLCHLALWHWVYCVSSLWLHSLLLSSTFPPSLPSPLLSSMPSTPPTSPQRDQAAGRHAEHLSRIMGSPEQRRTPAAPSSTLSAAAAPSLPSREPVTFQGQTYHHLPPELAAQIASTSSISTAPQQHRRSLAAPLLAPAPVSVSYLPLSNKLLTYNLQIILPPAPASASTSTMPPPQHYRRRLATSLLAPAPVSFNSL